MKGHQSDNAAAELGSAGGSAGTPRQTQARQQNAARATEARMTGMSAAERQAQAAKAGRASAAKLTPEQRSAAARRRWETRRKNAGLTVARK